MLVFLPKYSFYTENLILSLICRSSTYLSDGKELFFLLFHFFIAHLTIDTGQQAGQSELSAKKARES